MSKNKENKSEVSKEGFLAKTDLFLEKRKTSFFWFSAFALFLFSLLLFQANISIGGDDSFYIIRAQKLVQIGKFPTFQGPLYPIVLAPFIALFGIKVHLLKTLSIIFSLVFLYMFYISFRNRINNYILVLSLLILAFNSHVLYYASQTYNEAFHLMIQLFFFYQFFKVYDMVKDSDADYKTQWKDWSLLGLTLFLMAISKNLGLVGIITVVGFFFIQGKWKSLAASVIPFGVLMGLFTGIKRLFFAADAQISKQGLMLLYKDPYNFSKGKEDLAGYWKRFYINADAYLSKNMMKLLNFRDADVTTRIELLTILIAALLVIGLFISYRKNKYVFFTGSYLTITLVTIFIVLQIRWDADRMVFLVLPFFVVFMLYTLDSLVRRSKMKFLQPVFFIAMIFYLFSSAGASTEKIDLLKLKKNLSGDKYLGYTPDWQNYLKISEWAGKNLPKNAYVASRKAAMSSIYANGKEFHNVSRVFSDNADDLLNAFQENSVTHVIMANLRRHPKQKSEYTINTVRRYLNIIETQYPGTFGLVYQEGQVGNEEAYLFQINYNVRAKGAYIP